MNRRSAVVLLVAAVAIASGCSKKELPKTMQAVPADAEIVATLDAQSIIAYAKQAVPKLVPAGMKDEIPAFDMIAKQARDMIGIDLDKIGRLVFIGYVGSEDKMAFIAEGVDGKALKGQQKGEHNGVPLFEMEASIHYASLGPLGVVAGPSQEMVKKVLDASAGKAKSIAGSDRADMLRELTGVEKDFNQFRAYLLTGKLPDAGPVPFTMKGGGFFLHIDKGAAGTVVSDSSGASDIKTNLDQGLMVLQMAMAGGGDMGLPMDLDEESKKVITDVLKNLRTDKSGDMVSVVYRGDLKPLVEKAMAVAMDMRQSMSDEEPAPGSPAAAEESPEKDEPPTEKTPPAKK